MYINDIEFVTFTNNGFNLVVIDKNSFEIEDI